MLANKLKDLVGPILDLPPIDQSEVKFNGRSRLYIGNLTNDVTEEEILNLFNPFGENAELFLNKEKNFGFIKMVSWCYSIIIYLYIIVFIAFMWCNNRS